MNEKTRESLEKVLKSIIVALTVLVFEHGFIANGFYENVARLLSLYSKAISISIAGTFLAIGCMKLFGGIITEDEEGNIKINSSSVISFLVIILFAIFEISRIW